MALDRAALDLHRLRGHRRILIRLRRFRAEVRTRAINQRYGTYVEEQEGDKFIYARMDGITQTFLRLKSLI